MESVNLLIEKTMDLGKEFFVSLLLVVALASFNFAQTPSEKTDFDYFKNCSTTQAYELISLMRNITTEKLPYIDRKLLVLTDSEQKMYAPLRKKLEEDNSIFLPFHKGFNNDMEVTFATALVFRYVSHVKFLIHSDSIDNAANIFQNLIRIFPNVVIFHKNIAFALTIAEKKNFTELMMKKLEEVAVKSNRSDVSIFLKNNENLPIGVFGNKPLERNVNEFVLTFMNDVIKDQERYLYFYYDLNFSQQYEELIHCSINFANRQILMIMKNYSENFNSSLGLLEHSPEEVGATQNVWSIIKTNTAKDVENYLNRFNDCFQDVKHKWQKGIIWATYSEKASKNVEDSFEEFLDCFKNDYQLIFPETDELRVNIRVINFLWYYGNHSEFPKSAINWMEPLERFREKYIKNLRNFYHRTEKGQLLQRRVEQKCMKTGREYKLNITGNAVKLSDIDFGTCRVFPRVIELFATEKAILDVDMELIGKEVQLIIIAPKWEVKSSATHGRVLINLSGENASNFKEDKAKNGTKDGNKNGAHGRAGNPGGPSGSFHGIADEIINPEKLTILANGGEGGKGQNGGHGVDGDDGKTYNGVPTFSCGTGVTGWVSVFISGTYPSFQVYSRTDKYEVIGGAGKIGGRGGNGGAGGMSGKKGSINVLELSKPNKSSLNLSAVDGKVGSAGIGGKPGLGGQNGRNVIVYCANGNLDNAFVKEIKEIYIDNGRANTGLKGQPGVSLKNRTIAKSSYIVQSFASSVNKYRMYLRPYLANADFTDKSITWTFYNALATDENITKMYDTLTLVEEFIGLEKQFFSLNKQMNFTPSYEHLKNRIDIYAENPSKLEDTFEYRNIFKDLKVDVEDGLKTVRSLQSWYDVNTNLVEEANLYLLPFVNEIKDFRRTNIILRNLKQTINLLEDNIRGGNKIISDQVSIAISASEDTLDQELDSLLREITEMEKKAYANQEELKKSREKLRDIMLLKSLFGVLKVGCGALGIINPALGLVGAAAVSAISVIEAKTTDEAEAQVAVLPKALENLAKESESYFTNLKNQQEKVIKEQEKYVNMTKQTATFYGIAIIDQVWHSAEKYRGKNEVETLIRQPGHAMMQVYAHQESELITNLKQLEDSDKKVDPEKAKAIEIGIKVAKYLKVTSEAFKTGSETAISIMKDEKKVSEIDAALNKSHNALRALHLLEENIYTNIEPLVDDMRSNLESVEHNLAKMNEFQQAVAKWNVTRNIENIKRTLNNVTKTFKVNEEINWTLNELINTFDLLFKLHESLSHNKEKQRDKIDETNLHIAHASNLQISNSQLRYALSELQLIRMTNYVAGKYHAWISAFKQFAFPYCGEELSEFKDLDTFTNAGIDNFASFITKKINFIIADSSSKKFTNEQKEVIFRGSNSLQEGSKFSFYIWRNKDDKEALHNILNGSETKLVANIHKSGLDYNALKFNRVKIVFTAKSQEMQEELTNELNNFDVQLTHHGDSVYRLGDSIYELRNTPTTLEFTYAINSTERELMFVSSLAEGPYMLSPYATWSIKLLPIQPSRDFESLQQFANFVDLELVGNAVYSKKYEDDLTCKYNRRVFYG